MSEPSRRWPALALRRLADRQDQWYRVGNLVMLGNCCTMHRGTLYEDTRWKRDTHCVTTSDKPEAFGISECAQRTTQFSAEY